MPLAPGSVPQQDTLTADIIAQLIVVSQQIAGIGTCYPEVPEGPPEHNSVMYLPLSIAVHDDDTNGKLVLDYDFEVDHLFRRVRLQQNLAQIQAALPAWLHVFTAWANITLFGLVQSITLSKMKIAPYKHGGQDYLIISMTVTVRPILNIDTAA